MACKRLEYNKSYSLWLHVLLRQFQKSANLGKKKQGDKQVPTIIEYCFKVMVWWVLHQHTLSFASVNGYFRGLGPDQFHKPERKKNLSNSSSISNFHVRHMVKMI